jgi:DNA replication and repair protein RecF
LILSRLKIRNLRIIKNLDIELSSGLNIFQGNNGAGKTSILEAIYLLSRNKTFRSNSKNSLITKNKKNLTVNALIQLDDKSHRTIDLKKTISATQTSINGKRLYRSSQIAKQLIVGTITSNIHQLMEGGPVNRRRFIDWIAFHVEHDYLKHLKQYNYILKQRNQALIYDNDQLDIWDEQLEISASLITDIRRALLEELNIIISNIQKDYYLDEVRLEFSQGWNRSVQLKNELLQKVKSDKRRGFTSIGPHRADAKIKMSNVDCTEILSRGQQKVVCSVTMLAALLLIQEKLSETPILLLDEVFIELDETSTNFLFDKFMRSGLQILMTSINCLTIGDGVFKKVFHVEQGKIL